MLFMIPDNMSKNFASKKFMAVNFDIKARQLSAKKTELTSYRLA